MTTEPSLMLDSIYLDFVGTFKDVDRTPQVLHLRHLCEAHTCLRAHNPYGNVIEPEEECTASLAWSADGTPKLYHNKCFMQELAAELRDSRRQNKRR